MSRVRQFIGREAELARLDDALDRAIGGTAATVLVGGDAGIGKSRLIAEFTAHARRKGALVLEGGCVSLGDGGGLPFAPIVEALRRLPALLAEGAIAELDAIDDLRSPATAELGRLVPELGSSGGLEALSSDRPEWTQARIFEGLLALLQALGERVPVVLILEDLHWADGSTRDVTSFLARNARSERALARRDVPDRRPPSAPSAARRGFPRWSAFRASNGSSSRGSGAARWTRWSQRSLTIPRRPG